jgi:hypothetical protein
MAAKREIEVKPVRVPWNDFPDVVIHSPELEVKGHASYAAAKSGDPRAAMRLVYDQISGQAMKAISKLIGSKAPLFVSVHALENLGVNAIPEVLADELGSHFGLNTDRSIVQTNVVSHTGADGFSRLGRPALFDGDVIVGQAYFLVDDFVGQGGTLANFRGYVEANGGIVLGATVLTGKPFSAKMRLTEQRLTSLREKYADLEFWWKDYFGYGFDCLTESEARYLERSPNADTIRNKVTAAEQEGNR